MSNFYGHVDGERPADMSTAVDTDPFESLLGLCRMLHIHYEITEKDGKWSVRIQPADPWPGNFYGSASGTGTLWYGVVGSTDRLQALRVALSMCWGGLVDSSRHWKRIVSRLEGYKHWPGLGGER